VGFEPTHPKERILELGASTALASLYTLSLWKNPHALIDDNTFILTQYSPPRLSNFAARLKINFRLYLE
jgi:hypothetical protein